MQSNQFRAFSDLDDESVDTSIELLACADSDESLAVDEFDDWLDVLEEV